ncbi:MAG: hypothetical protein K2N25_01705 [Muribaculaceae bacterium]|nr:hypothetical protein [Muribaculaceae bacterium]
MKSSKDNTEEFPGRNVLPGVLTLDNVSVKEAGRSLSSVYYDQRMRLIEPFARMVCDGLLNASPLSAMKMKGFLRDIRRDGSAANLSDAALTQIYNSFTASLENVLAVAKADIRYQEAWKRLITNLELDTTELKQELGREIAVASGYAWHYTTFAEVLFSPLTVTDIWETYSQKDRNYKWHGSLSMGVSTRIALSDLFFGKESRLPHLTARLPENEHFETEDFEQATATDILTLDGVALNGSMLGNNGSISAAAVKKVKSQTPISDFRLKFGRWLVDRVEMLCLTYFTLLEATGKTCNKELDIKMLVRFAVEKMPGWIIGPMFNTFIPDLQGFTKSWTVNSYAAVLASTVQHILMEACDEWLDLDNFKMMLLCSPKQGNNNYTYLNLFEYERRRKAKLIRRADKEFGIIQENPVNWFDEVGFKFAIHWIKYLCALGMVEIAVDTRLGDSSDVPMEGMRFVRLTTLGRYALGIDDDYVSKAAEWNNGVEFEGLNGIITVDAGSPFHMFLSTVAKRISPTRFHISTDTLLRGCRKKSDLEKRVSNLRTIIDPEKEPALRDIIDEAMRHTDCTKRDGGYSLLRLRPDLPGLRDLLLSNRELREMTILAGPTLALVKTHEMERFNELCAAYGYLME